MNYELGVKNLERRIKVQTDLKSAKTQNNKQ